MHCINQQSRNSRRYHHRTTSHYIHKQICICLCIYTYTSNNTQTHCVHYNTGISTANNCHQNYQPLSPAHHLSSLNHKLQNNKHYYHCYRHFNYYQYYPCGDRFLAMSMSVNSGASTIHIYI